MLNEPLGQRWQQCVPMAVFDGEGTSTFMPVSVHDRLVPLGARSTGMTPGPLPRAAPKLELEYQDLLILLISSPASGDRARPRPGKIPGPSICPRPPPLYIPRFG